MAISKAIQNTVLVQSIQSKSVGLEATACLPLSSSEGHAAQRSGTIRLSCGGDRLWPLTIHKKSWAAIALGAVSWGLMPFAAQAQTELNHSLVESLGQDESASQLVAQAFPEPILDIGIVQRFGEEDTDRLVLDAVGGDRFSVAFETGGQPQEITTSKVTLEVVTSPLPEPELLEKVVLSSHRSFESAEDSAKYWESKGIEVELAQPQQWQVWGKRSVYRTPLLRRLLLQNLQANGATTAFLDSEIITEKPQAAFIVDGFRYHRDRVTIDAGRDQARIDVKARETAKRLYGGDFRLQPNAYGTYTLVNEVPLETYLRGVVPYEIGLGAPPTTIEAQAILARTYSLRNLRRFAIDDYELCADTQCQVYWGISGAADVTDRAIAATRGQVLTYDNELVDALYSSTTGGVTASFSDVWNGPDRPYLQPVVDSVYGIWDLSNHNLSTEASIRSFLNINDGFNEVGWEAFRWRRDGTLITLANDVRAYLKVIQHPLVNFSSVEKLEITKRSPSGRVQELVVTTNLGDVVLGKDEVIRALYPPRSTLFYIEPIYEEVAQEEEGNEQVAIAPGQAESPLPSSKPESESEALSLDLTESSPAPDLHKQVELIPEPEKILKGYAFIGGGFGHGVGMSQTGAYKLGKLGWSSDRILSFYYPGTSLQPLNDNITFWSDPAESLSLDAAARVMDNLQPTIHEESRENGQADLNRVEPSLEPSTDSES